MIANEIFVRANKSPVTTSPCYCCPLGDTITGRCSYSSSTDHLLLENKEMPKQALLLSISLMKATVPVLVQYYLYIPLALRT